MSLAAFFPFAFRTLLSIAVSCAVIVSAGPLSAQQPTNEENDRTASLLKQFPEADTNGDGKLSKDESLALKLEQWLKRFPQADANGDGTLTKEEALQFQQQRRKQAEEKPRKNQRAAATHANVKYGEHKLQAFDLYLADPKKAGEPTPLCIYIHGGGFRGGDKAGVQKGIIDRFLHQGISFASMNYRLTNGGEFPYPTAMHDSARGLQMIRSKSKEWNIDPQRIVCYGGSAGAGISLWLAFHDDLADAKSDDLVAQQSTRILAAGTMNGQSTYDMRTYRDWFEVDDLPPHPAIVDFYGMKPDETADTPRVAKLAEDASAINHLSKDDPPVFMTYGQKNSAITKETNPGVWVHHPLLGLKLQEAMQKIDLECTVVYPGQKERPEGDLFDFLIKKLKE